MRAALALLATTLLVLSAHASAAPAVACDATGCSAEGGDPAGSCAASGRLRGSAGSWDLRCERDGEGVGSEGSASPAGLSKNDTLHGQSSESGSLSSYRSGNSTFHCAIDGCAVAGDDGSGPASIAYNATPHWTVDSSPPTLALAHNGTVAADLDGDGAPDLVASSNDTHDGAGAGHGPASVQANHTRPGRPTFGDVTFEGRVGSCGASATDNGTSVAPQCRETVATPAGTLLLFVTPDGEGALVFAQGAAHGCFVENAAPTSPKCA